VRLGKLLQIVGELRNGVGEKSEIGTDFGKIANYLSVFAGPIPQVLPILGFK